MNILQMLDKVSSVAKTAEKVIPLAIASRKALYDTVENMGVAVTATVRASAEDPTLRLAAQNAEKRIIDVRNHLKAEMEMANKEQEEFQAKAMMAMAE